METVNRLAASVSTKSTTQESNPALVRSGSLTVERNAHSSSVDPMTDMLAKNARPFQFGLFVMFGDPSHGGHTTLLRTDCSTEVVKMSRKTGRK